MQSRIYLYAIVLNFQALEHAKKIVSNFSEASLGLCYIKMYYSYYSKTIYLACKLCFMT